jgi:small subunit ribosomal protein S16
MALKIRLRRMGRKKAPHYRIVIAESTMPRDGRFVATIGHYNPTTTPETLKVDRDKANAWIAKGAVPTDTVRSLFRKAGVFKPESALEAVASTVTTAAATAGKAVKGAAGKVAGAAASAASAVASVASDAAGTVADAASSVVEAVKDAAETVADKVTGGDEAPAAEASADEAPAAEAETAEAPAVEAAPVAEETAADAPVEADAFPTAVNSQITDEVAETPAEPSAEENTNS